MIILYSVESHHPTIESLCVDNNKGGETKTHNKTIVERIKCLELDFRTRKSNWYNRK